MPSAPTIGNREGKAGAEAILSPVQPTPYVREPGYAERYRDRRFATGSGSGTDRRERKALRALLRTLAAPSGPWLDAPAGAGRMSAELPQPVVRVDRDLAMLRAQEGNPLRVQGCATALPFADGTFAGALCCRLLQHLPTREERTAVLAELRRTTRGPVVVTFFDAHSLQSLRRGLRRAMGKTRSGRSAIPRAQFVREAEAAGLVVVRFVALRRFLAEQTFALLLPREP